MSPAGRSNTDRALGRKAPVFAALGDETRLALVTRLAGGTPLSISRLAHGSPMSRQAITKHLRVLQKAGMVRSIRHGRERLFELKPAPIEEASRTLAMISQRWDEALARLKVFVEESGEVE